MLGDATMHDWGWRVPFMVAGPMGLVGMYLRSKMEDTPVFLEAEQAAQGAKTASPTLSALITGHWRTLLVMGGLVTALNIVNYTLLSYMPTYLQRRLGLSANEALIVPIIGMMFMMVLLPFAGALSDRVGRNPLWWFSLIGLFVGVVPLYLLMATGLWGAIVGFALLGLLYVPQLATISATFPAMFPTSVRFAGFALAYNVATSIFGGTAPVIGSGLIGITGNELMPAFYMMFACVVGMIALRFLKESAGRSLRDVDIGMRG